MMGAPAALIGVMSLGLSDTSISISSPSPVSVSLGTAVACRAALIPIDSVSSTLPPTSNIYRDIGISS